MSDGTEFPDSDELEFARETDKELIETNDKPWKVLIVDDEKDIHKITRMVLEDIRVDGRPFEFMSAYSGKEAEDMVRENPDTALILLDVVMETICSGLDVITYIRDELKNHFMRIILRTGQPGHAPEREIINKYDINDYKLKTVLTDHTLFTAVVTAIRAYRDLRIIEKQRMALDQALRDATAARKAKAQFLANMHHELKTPLNGIIGATDILLKSETSESRKKFLEMIRISGRGLLEILSNVLEMTDIEEGRIVLAQKPFDLRKTVARLIDVMQIHADLKHLRVFYFIDNNVPDNLIGDPDRLKQVLMNLILNAIKYTDTGCIAMNIALFGDSSAKRKTSEVLPRASSSPPKIESAPVDGKGQEETSEIFLLFEVNDTGIGISQKKRDKIFEPFVLGEDVMTKRLGGAGLGLAISKDIIEKMNGRIWLDSKPGQGASFYFSAGFKMKGKEHAE